jgi:hypothetical protein
MSDHLTLHKIRQCISNQRQPSLVSKLGVLDKVLKKLKLPHPYKLSSRHWQEILKEKALKEGGAGLIADPPSKEFLYRFCAIKTLVNKKNKETAKWKDPIFGAQDSVRIHEKLMGKSLNGQQWLPLSDYLEGSLAGPRQITWWTSFEIPEQDIVCSVQKLGLLWVGPHSVVLRCPIKYVKERQLARVPTALDAFDSEVFHPTKEQDEPKSGVTISLEHSEALEEGADEFVLGPIDVKQVNMIPVLLNEDTVAACKAWSDENLWELLEFYYKKTCGSCPDPAAVVTNGGLACLTRAM